jgi:phospholipase C
VVANGLRCGDKTETSVDGWLSAFLSSSFDHYYGYARQVQAKGYGPPAKYFQPDSSGGMGLRALRQHRQRVRVLEELRGYFDHVAPPQVDAYGMGVRVPLWVVSPYAKVGPVEANRAAAPPRDGRKDISNLLDLFSF